MYIILYDDSGVVYTMVVERYECMNLSRKALGQSKCTILQIC